MANPQGTDKFVANGSTPILIPHRPAVVINDSFNFPLRHIITEGTDMNGFILNDCEIKPLSFLGTEEIYATDKKMTWANVLVIKC